MLSNQVFLISNSYVKWCLIKNSYFHSRKNIQKLYLGLLLCSKDYGGTEAVLA